MARYILELEAEPGTHGDTNTGKAPKQRVASARSLCNPGYGLLDTGDLDRARPSLGCSPDVVFDSVAQGFYGIGERLPA